MKKISKGWSFGSLIWLGISMLLISTAVNQRDGYLTTSGLVMFLIGGAMLTAQLALAITRLIDRDSFDTRL